jgi:hypothetical protein
MRGSLHFGRDDGFALRGLGGEAVFLLEAGEGALHGFSGGGACGVVGCLGFGGGCCHADFPFVCKKV